MGLRSIVPESQFLTQLALREFNYQTGSKIDWRSVNIYSIPPIDGYTHGYEINSNTLGDTLRIQMFLNVGTEDDIGRYRLENKAPFKPGVLGDECFVFRGTIDDAHTKYDGYRLLWIGQDISVLPILLQANSSPFLLVDGGFIKLS